MDEAATLLELFTRRVEADGDRNAFHRKRGGAYEPLTWKQMADDVFRAAAALKNLGVAPGDRVIQFAENRYEWIICDLAIQFAQAVHVPVHAPLTGDQATFQITDSGAKLVLIADQEQADKLHPCAESFAKELQFVSFDPCKKTIGGQKVVPLSEVATDISCNEANALAQQARDAIGPDDLTTILYTSGTTGEPKGVMLSQRNLTSNTLGSMKGFRLLQNDVRLGFLPLSHIFARTCDLYGWIAAGCEFALADSRETVIADCALLRPTILNGVPYFFDRVRRALIEQNRADEKDALRQLLGGRIRMCGSGGAALPNHVFDFFLERDVPIVQGYGLTETSPVITISPEGALKRGSAGKPIVDVETRIADDGEILTRGPHVMMGYYKDADATAEVLRDGWFSTGDLGYLDDEGYLFITGRKKELIVTSGGKNIAPVYLESLLTQDPLILQAMVIGDDRKYLTALIVPNPDALKAEIAARKIRVFTPKQALSHPQVQELYKQRIDERLVNVSHYEQIQKFTLLDRGFTIESGELTPKLSLRRQVIATNFTKEIEAMYA